MTSQKEDDYVIVVIAKPALKTVSIILLVAAFFTSLGSSAAMLDCEIPLLSDAESDALGIALEEIPEEVLNAELQKAELQNSVPALTLTTVEEDLLPSNVPKKSMEKLRFTARELGNLCLIVGCTYAAIQVQSQVLPRLSETNRLVLATITGGVAGHAISSISSRISNFYRSRGFRAIQFLAIPLTSIAKLSRMLRGKSPQLSNLAGNNLPPIDNKKDLESIWNENEIRMGLNASTGRSILASVMRLLSDALPDIRKNLRSQNPEDIQEAYDDLALLVVGMRQLYEDIALKQPTVLMNVHKKIKGKIDIQRLYKLILEYDLALKDHPKEHPNALGFYNRLLRTWFPQSF